MAISNLENQALLTGLRFAVPSEMLDGLGKHVQQVDEILQRYENRVQQINGNPDLTDSGKKRLRMEAAQKAAEELDNLRRSAKGYDEHILQLQEAIKPQTPQGDAVLQHLQEREIRDRLREVDPLVARTMYLEAANNGDDDALMYAMENAPKAFPVLMGTDVQQLIDEGMQKRAERQSPEQAKKLAELLRVRRALDSAIANVRSKLALPEDDPVKVLAEAE